MRSIMFLSVFLYCSVGNAANQINVMCKLDSVSASSTKTPMWDAHIPDENYVYFVDIVGKKPRIVTNGGKVVTRLTYMHSNNGVGYWGQKDASGAMITWAIQILEFKVGFTTQTVVDGVLSTLVGYGHCEPDRKDVK